MRVWLKMEKKFETIKAFFEAIWKDPKAFPDKAIILPIEKEKMAQVFTKKRIEIIRVVRKHKELSVTEIARITKRELTAVIRDLKILAELGIVQVEKQGRVVKATVNAKVLILPLVELKPITI